MPYPMRRVLREYRVDDRTGPYRRVTYSPFRLQILQLKLREFQSARKVYSRVTFSGVVSATMNYYERQEDERGYCWSRMSCVPPPCALGGG